MMLFGIIGANGSKILFGELLWDPLLIVDNWTSKVHPPPFKIPALLTSLPGWKSSSILLCPRLPNRLNRRQHLCKFHLLSHRSLSPPPKIHQHPAGPIYLRCHRCLGNDALEHLGIRWLAHRFHERLYDMACSHFRDFDRRLLFCS